MDVVRGSAVLLIVVFHATVVVESYGGLTAPQWLADVNTVITPLRIPLLVLLSGMLLGASFRKGRRRYFSGKARKIAWPYLVWSVIWGVGSWPVYSVLGYALGGSYLWFLLYLVTFYCVAWLLRAVPPELVVLAAAAASGVASFLLPGASTDAERWPYLLAVFMAGHLITVRPGVRTWVFSSGWAVVAAAVLLAVHLGLSLGYDYGLESALFMLAGAVISIRLARSVGSARLIRPVRFVGRHSLAFYVSHYPLMAAVAVGAAASGATSAYALTAVLVAAAVLVGTGLVLLGRRPPVSWLFTFPVRRRAGRDGSSVT